MTYTTIHVMLRYDPTPPSKGFMNQYNSNSADNYATNIEYHEFLFKHT